MWVHWTHGPINVISVYFKDSQFEFRVNQESYGFFQCYHWILHPVKHGFRNQNLVSIYPRCGVISENVIELAGRHFEMALYR